LSCPAFKVLPTYTRINNPVLEGRTWAKLDRGE
jgi:hypothetical protein